MANDLEIIRGDDETIEVTLTDEDSLPINITNVNMFFTVKEDYDDADSLAKIRKSIPSGIHTAPVSGMTQIALTHHDTSIDPGDYVWDLQLVYSDGSVNSTKMGKLIILPDVSIGTS